MSFQGEQGRNTAGMALASPLCPSLSLCSPSGAAQLVSVFPEDLEGGEGSAREQRVSGEIQRQERTDGRLSEGKGPSVTGRMG